MKKELAEQSSQFRTYVIRGLFGLLLYVGGLMLIYGNGGNVRSDVSLGAGRELFWNVVYLEALAIYLFLPAMTAGALAGEKERESLSLLLLTTLPPWSILVQKLVQEKKLATSIRIYTGFPGERFTNLFFISAIPAPDVDYDTLEKAIQEELQQIRENGVSQQHLQKVQKKALSDFAFGLRSPSQLADLLSYYQIMTGDYKSLFRSYETMKELTPEEIKKAANEYLKPEWTMRARLISEGQ